MSAVNGFARETRAFPTEAALETRFVELIQQTTGIALVWCSAEHRPNRDRDAGVHSDRSIHPRHVHRARAPAPQATTAGEELLHRETFSRTARRRGVTIGDAVQTQHDAGSRSGPMPVRGAADHVDVLARQGRGRALRVFDVKRIAAGDVKHALDQAVAYCAAIQFMLKADLSGPLRSLMGFKRDAVRLPALEAVAVVNDTRENRDAIQASARRLAGRRRAVQVVRAVLPQRRQRNDCVPSHRSKGCSCRQRLVVMRPSTTRRHGAAERARTVRRSGRR